MKLNLKTIDLVDEAFQNMQPTRESIALWYDVLSTARDEAAFEPGAEPDAELLDLVLADLVIELVTLSVSP